MPPTARWWDTPFAKAVASLAVALAFLFLPFAIDAIRARRSATPIQIVASDDDGASPRTSPLRYDARSEATSAPAESVVVAVTITNAGADSALVTVSERCPVMFLLRAPADSTRRVVWDGRERPCPAADTTITLAGGGAATLRSALSVGDVLGDSLPEGRYLVTAVATVNGETVTRNAGAPMVRWSTRRPISRGGGQ